MLDNHKLSLQLSKRRPTAAAEKKSEGAEKKGKKSEEATTKLVVRNVAFEATRKVCACVRVGCSMQGYCVCICAGGGEKGGEEEAPPVCGVAFEATRKVCERKTPVLRTCCGGACMVFGP